MSSTPSSGSTLTSCRFSDPAAVCVASQSSALSSTEPSSFWPTTRARTHSGPATLEFAIHASVSTLISSGAPFLLYQCPFTAPSSVNREAARTVITAVLQLASTAAFNKTRNPDGHNHNHMDGGVTDGRGDGAVDDNTQGNTHA